MAREDRADRLVVVGVAYKHRGVGHFSTIASAPRSGKTGRTRAPTLSGRAILCAVPSSLYESLSLPPSGLSARGRTEGTKTQETIDRDRDSVSSWDLLSPRPRAASLYRTLDDATVTSDTHGRTIKTSRKETLDNDVEATALELGMAGAVGSLYGRLSTPAPNELDPARTESTRDAGETLDNDRESGSLALPLSLDG